MKTRSTLILGLALAIEGLSQTIRTGDLTTERTFHTATLLRNGKVLITGGGGDGFLAAELYDPVSGTFTATSSMIAPRFTRFRHTATLLNDGTVLIAGGDATTFAEIFAPATATFASSVAARQWSCSATDSAGRDAALR
jgi:hypothetical protein